MNKEKYNQILDKAYIRYCNIFEKEWMKLYDSTIGDLNHNALPIPKEEFINRIKTDDEFAKKWGLKIEEKELSLEERFDIHKKYITEDKLDLVFEFATNENLDKLGVPTKLITLTYNNEIIENYE